ncbi:hypothetical protein, variant [Cladophialophora immunda]|uniref:ASTRA-associated protein 1 n=1 Tax=Cladophialophora immunda TaxID=569365 RepID=A0A0D2DD30_9EURO|nr:hypothetical protein, variant [Cladophialophora immunda]KIW33624.1 hypothetical protein, variant [Cladophialophora immunda]
MKWPFTPFTSTPATRYLPPETATGGWSYGVSRPNDPWLCGRLMRREFCKSSIGQRIDLSAAAAASSSPSSEHPQPWLLHSMSVNALNFCAFSMCDQDPRQPGCEDAVPQLIASPNGLDSGGMDIFQLPSERRVSQIRSDKNNSMGMVMAVCLFHQTTDTASPLVLVSGYEDGRITIHVHPGDLTSPGSAGWQKVASCKAHAQPILSLAILPSTTHFFTSSADSVVSKFRVPSLADVQGKDLESEKAINTKHSGQQGLSVRSDGKIFATAGWDGRVRVYSCKTVKELAVLKWHKVGCYSTAFATIDPIETPNVGGTDDVLSSSSATNAAGEGAVLSSITATKALTKPMNAVDMIKQQREEKARRTHWLAAGGKDGKISLWDIY